jgi:transcription elongation factor GreA
MSNPVSAAELFRDVRLLADGPLRWGRPVPARGSGLFVVELAAPLPTAPLELTRIGKWLERVPDLRLDGARPSSRALHARLGSFWLPSQTVLYVGWSETSIGGRVAAHLATALGDRRPYSGGHWLATLNLPATTRVWWAATDAVEEYLDAVLTRFADGVSEAELAGLPDRAVVLPFANLRRPTGERRATGLTGSLLPEPAAVVAPPTRVVVVPDGDAEGARGEPPAPRARRPKVAATKAAAGTATPAKAAAAATPAAPPPSTPSMPESTTMTADGVVRLQAELDELVTVRRPQVIARIRAAKELGDLKENADYAAAREEQSFLEGRIQALENRLRTAVIAAAPIAGEGADLGSVVTVDVDGDEDTYTLVGSGESSPGAGRLSLASPVGRALLGSRPGDTVAVTTPRGVVQYRVLRVE